MTTAQNCSQAQAGHTTFLPTSAHFLLNDKCNAKCVFCGGNYYNSRSGRMMTLEKFKIIADSIHLEHYRQAILAGAGDPLLCPDFVPIMQHLHAAYPTVEISVTTNGIGLNRELSEAMLSCGVTMLNISLNAATREKYQRLMQVDAFEKICKQLRDFSTLCRERGKGPQLQLSIPIMRCNVEELPLLIQFAHEVGAGAVNVFYCRFYPREIRNDKEGGFLPDKESLFYYQELSDLIVTESEQLAQRLGVQLMHEPLFSQGYVPKKCSWADNELMIGFDGEVFPCGGGELHFKKRLERGEYNFGNALLQPIEEFWNNDSYRAIRVSSKRSGQCVIPECRECSNMTSHMEQRGHILEWAGFSNGSGLDATSQLPLVSVIVPTHNRPDMLKDTIQSILDQTYQSFEIIVVNDAGQDVSSVVQAFNSPKISYLSHETNKGLAAARNTGIRVANGKYIAYLDDDDIFYPEHLNTLVTFLQESGESVAYTDAYRAHQIMQEDGAYAVTERDVPYSFDFNFKNLLVGNFIPVTCFMHDIKCIHEAGYFDEDLHSHEDWDLWIRMSQKFPFHHIKNITCEFRWREDGTSMTSSKELEFISTQERVYKKYQYITQSMPDVVEMQKNALADRKKVAERGINTSCSIIIPVFNQLDYTSRCLETLYDVTSLENNFEVIVVDNASCDGTPAYLLQAVNFYPNLRVIRNDTNLLFAGACNQGAEAAFSEILIFLNNDTEPLAGWLENGLATLRTDPDIGILGAKLLYPDRTIQHCGIEFFLKDAAPYFVWPEHRYRGAAENDPCVNIPGPVQAVTGACLFIHRSLYENVGGFDTSFGMYAEDSDLCFKVRELGLKIYYEPTSVLIHHEAKSSFDKAAAWKLNDHALGIFYQKWGHAIAELVLHAHIDRIDGKYVYLSETIYPVLSDSEGLFRFFLLLQAIPPFFLHFGGAGDALLLFSTFYDREPKATIISMPNSPESMRSLCDAFQLLEHVYLLPHNTTMHTVLRTFARKMPKFLGMGITPVDYDTEWNERLDIVSQFGVSMKPAWLQRFAGSKLEPFQVVLAPKGSLLHHQRSKRNIVPPRFWLPVLKVLQDSGIRPIIIGTPDEAIAYPADDGCFDLRSYSFQEQMVLIKNSDLLIGADSWQKTFAALASVPAIVFQAVTGYDLAGVKDNSEYVFIDPWENISLVGTMDEFTDAFTEFKQYGKFLTRRCTLPQSQLPTNFISSFSPVFWGHDYRSAENLLIRCSPAIGDALYLTAIVAELKRQYPHLRIHVSGDQRVEWVFRYHPALSGFVPINSNEELALEATIDVTVEYNHILDCMTEYRNGIRFFDILANIAGVHLNNRQMIYTVTRDEALWAEEEIRPFADSTLKIGLQFVTNKDIKRSYPHGAPLIKLLQLRYPNACFFLFGQEPLGEENPGVYDCAGRSTLFRNQMALARQCDAFITIDSAFFHVGHNLYHKPTLLIAGPTNPSLIGVPEFGTVTLVRNMALDCLNCYWQKECSIECMEGLTPEQIVETFASMMLTQQDTCAEMQRPFEEVTLNVSDHGYYQQEIINALCGRREPVSLILNDPHGILPEYAVQWNGVVVKSAEKAASNPISAEEAPQPPYYEKIRCLYCSSTDAKPFRSVADIVQCLTCGTVYLRTRMTQEAMYQLYQSYADGESHMAIPATTEAAQANGLRREHIMRELLSFVSPHGTLLDVGCGWGAFLDNARNKGFSPRGIEMTRKCVAFATQSLSLNVTNDQFLDTPFEDNSLSVVTMLHVLEHLPRPKEAINKVFQILEPGGIFCGIVPNIDSVCSQCEGDNWEWLDPYYHYVHYSPATIRKHLEEAGFIVERLYTACDDYRLSSVQNYIGMIKGATDPATIEEFRKQFEDAGQGEAIRFYVRKPITDYTSSITRVSWHGGLFVHHSLALVNRELCLQLIGHGFDISFTSTQPDEFNVAEDGRLKPLEGCRNKQFPTIDVTVRHQWPPDFSPVAAGKLVVIQPWEFGSVPVDWVRQINQNVDELWVPSSFVRECYLQSGVQEGKVQLVPNGVAIECFHQAVPPCHLPTNKSFRFLFVGGTIQRKGIDILLAAYAAKFSATDDVCLVIKDMGKGGIYQGQTAEDMIAAFRSVSRHPEIVYIEDMYDDCRMAALYNACHCLVHPYRGEGFGLPIAEAMACGLASMVTGYGAALDFCPPEIAWLIPAEKRMLPEKKIGNLVTVDYPWLAEPDLDALAALMRHAFEHPDEVRQRGSAASRHIREHFSWDHAAQVAEQRLRLLAQKAEKGGANSKQPGNCMPQQEPVDNEAKESEVAMQNQLVQAACFKAEKLAQRGDVDAAVQVMLNEGIGGDADSPIPYLALSGILMAAGRFEEVLGVAAEMPPATEKHLIHEIEAQCFCALGDDAAARKAAMLAGEQRPLALVVLGTLSARQGNTAQGEQLFRRAIALDCNCGKAWLSLAMILWSQGKLPDAWEAVKQAVSLDPLNAEAVKIMRDMASRMV